jgi:AraC-like DNA-binding protein
MKTASYDHALFEKVIHSEIFETYQDAFHCATGLSLRLVGVNVEEWCLGASKQNRSSFCEALNLCKSACSACIDTNRRLMKDASVYGPSTCHCFAGLTATAVPIRCESRLIGFLKTGHVFNQVPKAADFDRVSKTISRQGLEKEKLEQLREAYLQTQSVEPERYQSMITLLAIFAEQLGQQAEKLMIIGNGGESATISKACDFVEKNLSEPLSLSLVARHAGLSDSHFCRTFRKETGLTLTDYVTRRRIQWAKRELLKSEARISEIAFLIGYQSLSQFNRSFVKLTGRSPSQYRMEELTSLAS